MTNPSRLLRMNSTEDHLTERERRVRQSIKRGGKKNKNTFFKKNVRNTGI